MYRACVKPWNPPLVSLHGPRLDSWGGLAVDLRGGRGALLLLLLLLKHLLQILQLGSQQAILLTGLGPPALELCQLPTQLRLLQLKPAQVLH